MMRSFITILTLLVSWSEASPFNLDQYKRVEGGFSIPARKRDLGPPLRKRANEAATNDRWWISLGIGTPPQDLNFLPDSGANDFSMQSTLLPQSSRGNGLFFDPSKSTSAKQMQGYTYSEAFGSGYSDSGLVYTETIKLGSGTFANVPILLTTQASSPSENDRTGNLGIDPDTGGQSTSPKRVPTFMQSIRSSLAKGVITVSYNSYTLNGEIDFGYIDTTKYTGNLVYVPKQSGSTEWTVTFDGMIVNGQLKKTPFTTIIDTGTGGAAIPKANLDAYFAQVPSASYSSSAGTYVYPCNATLPDMIFSIGGLALHIPPNSWRGDPIGNTNNCQCSFQASDGTILGEVFIEGAFIVFDFDNMNVGFANKPALSTTIPTYATAGNTKFCTGTNFGGTCSTIDYKNAVCNPLSGQSFYHNIGSFTPNRGSCTLYSDAGCTKPYSDSSTIRSPGKSDAGTSGKNAGSYMCIWPSDYPPTKNGGEMQFCTDIDFRGNCQFIDWTSYVCNALPANAAKNVKSAGPYPGYCYWYTDAGCTKAVEDGAPMVYPGVTRMPFGTQVQSFMCI